MYYISCLELYNCVYACILYITIRVGLIRLHWTWKIVINGLLKSSPIYPYPFKSKSLHMQNKNIPPHLRLKDVLTKCCLSLKPVLLADPACQRAEFKVEGRSLPNSLPSSSLARICPLRSWTPESRWFQGIGNGGCWNHPPPLPHLGWGWLGYYRCWVTTGMLTHIACMRTRICTHYYIYVLLYLLLNILLSCITYHICVITCNKKLHMCIYISISCAYSIYTVHLWMYWTSQKSRNEDGIKFHSSTMFNRNHVPMMKASQPWSSHSKRIQEDPRIYSFA